MCVSCLQVDGSRLFKDVRTYYIAVKSRSTKHARHIRQCYLNPALFIPLKVNKGEANFLYSWIWFRLLQFCLRCHAVLKQIKSAVKKGNSRRSAAYAFHVQETLISSVVSFCSCMVSSSQETSCCSDLLCVGVATLPQTLKTIPPQCCVCCSFKMISFM